MHFETDDLNGIDFHVDFDGAEGIGFWVGDPENSTPLGMDETYALVMWVLENFKLGDED